MGILSYSFIDDDKSAFVGLRRLWKRKGKWRIGNEIKEIEEDGYEGKNCVH